MANSNGESNAPPSSNTSPIPVPVEWVQVIELGYEEDKNAQQQRPAICFACQKPQPKLSKCGRCNIALYCCRDCQVQDWKTGGHKSLCASYVRLNAGDKTTIKTDEFKSQAKSEILGRIRFYACSYGVYKFTQLGKGFLFIQSEHTLANVMLPQPKDAFGYSIWNRSILIHYLTLGEFDAEISRDDFEMAEVRTKLQELVNGYDEQTEYVVLMRFRCGHVALGKGPLVPDYAICQKLGKDYFAESTAGALQLNLDDI